MINYTSQNGDVQYNIVELIADTSADIVDLPKNCAPGSTCLVIEDSSVYMFGGDLEWHEI